MATETTTAPAPQKDEFFDHDNVPGYLKAGFLGFQGAGKSLTAAATAVITREYFKLTGPIAIFDTESGAGYLKAHIEEATGTKVLIKSSRSFSDLMKFTQIAMERGAAAAIVDSVTHPWRELCDSYLAQKNASRERWCKENRKPFYKQEGLQFEDWGPVKAKWAEFADLFLNSPLHFIIAGRAGFEYDKEEDERTHKKELIKTGVKMKSEGEFGYEPSLLVQLALDRTMVKKGRGAARMNSVRRAVVLKDRFMILDGKEIEFPSTSVFKEALGPVKAFFLPHLKLLTAGAHVPVDTRLKTEFEVGDEGDSGWQREKRNRLIVSEEIEGVLVEAYPGQTKEEKQAKARLLKAAFATFSWTAIQNLPSEVLRSGLKVIVDGIRATKGDPGAVTSESAAIPAPTKAARKEEAAKELDAALACAHKNAPAPSTLQPGVFAKCPDCGETLGTAEELTLTAPGT